MDDISDSPIQEGGCDAVRTFGFQKDSSVVGFCGLAQEARCLVEGRAEKLISVEEIARMTAVKSSLFD